jgi:hypothetical protein
VAPFRWGFYGERVLEQVRAAHVDIQEDFNTLMYELTKDPRRLGLGILPLKDGPGGQFTVPFDDSYLIYEAYADHPWIHLLHVHWRKAEET